MLVTASDRELRSSQKSHRELASTKSTLFSDASGPRDGTGGPVEPPEAASYEKPGYHKGGNMGARSKLH